MVLSAALDNGYIFISLIAILTSVIGAVYYLNVIKEIFFLHSTPEYKILNEYSDFYINNKDTINNISNTNTNTLVKNINISTISSPFSITISIITLVILLFIFMNKEWLSMGTINLLFLLCAKEYYTCNLLRLLNTKRSVSNTFFNKLSGLSL